MEDVSKTEPTDAAVPQVVEPPKETQQQLFNQLLQPEVKLLPDEPPDEPSSPGHEPPNAPAEEPPAELDETGRRTPRTPDDEPVAGVTDSFSFGDPQ